MEWMGMDRWVGGLVGGYMTGKPKCLEEYLSQSDASSVEWSLMKFSIC